MRQNTMFTALLAGAGNFVAANSPTYGQPTKTTPSPTVAACAQVSSSWAAQIKTTPTPIVSAALAHDCLNSVPLDKNAALELVDAIEPYLDFQSDSAYKAHPPADYYYPPYDLFANLAKVRANLQAGVYKNEIDFQTDLYLQVFGKGHDGHYVYYPDALTKIFKYRRPLSLVSISEDGSSLPVIKVYEDVVANPKKASAIKLINGIPAAKYVLDTIAEASYNQDIDSAYNTMFYELSLAASAPGLKGYFNGGGRVGYFYRGPNTSLTFTNGTTVKFDNIAAVTGNFTGVTDGASFYKSFCVPKVAPANATATESAITNSTVPNYPKPVVATKDGIVSGYYLEGEGLNDVAVIALLAFENDSPAEFQAVCQEFFRQAVAAGKTKLVIDFQANGGGYILQGYDFFRQLFPDVVQDGYSRWKDSKSYVEIAKAISDEAANLDPFTSDDEDAIADYLSWFNYRYDLNLTNQDFLTFEDKFTPHVFQQTPYTALMRWNLSDPLSTTNSTFGMGMTISGYGNLTHITQPFKPENIVIVYDGVCASTCTLASEMLRIQGGVKSVAFGGRPVRGPIQGVGGVKGSQVLAFSDVYSYAQRAINITKDENVKKDLARFKKLPIQRSLAASLNVRDQILRDNVNDGLPAQFVVEQADCRLYWTADMITDVRAIWKAAANSAFNGAKCAYGGIKHGGSPSYPVPHKRDAASLAALAASSEQRLAEIRAQEPFSRSDSWMAVHRQKAVE
ncbi:Peptidase S41 family ustP-like protein [Cladobotryum mycophilum]|uniref:Peptidase S41 family ustP-like protein n=1 Tax=Cladobotryum mycophilum TaxID=491253 RepID=A0ABR0SQV0_9HYPO